MNDWTIDGSAVAFLRSKAQAWKIRRAGSKPVLSMFRNYRLHSGKITIGHSRVLRAVYNDWSCGVDIIYQGSRQGVSRLPAMPTRRSITILRMRKPPLISACETFYAAWQLIVSR